MIQVILNISTLLGLFLIIVTTIFLIAGITISAKDLYNEFIQFLKERNNTNE